MAIIKQNNIAYQHKVIFYIRDEFGYGFGIGNYIPVIRPIPCFEIGKNSNSYPNSIKIGKTHQIGFSLDG